MRILKLNLIWKNTYFLRGTVSLKKSKQFSRQNNVGVLGDAGHDTRICSILSFFRLFLKNKLMIKNNLEENLFYT